MTNINLTYPEKFNYIGQTYAYHGTPLMGGGLFVVPFIGIELTKEHPLNKMQSSVIYIDKSYLVFEHVSEIKSKIWFEYADTPDKEDIVTMNIATNNPKRYSLGGSTFLSRQRDDKKLWSSTDWFIYAQRFSLLLLPDSKISENIFYPFDKELYKANMNFDDVVSFARNEQIPEALKEKVLEMA